MDRRVFLRMAGGIASLTLLAFLALGCGLVLDAVSRGRRELKRLAYLAIPPPPWV